VPPAPRATLPHAADAQQRIAQAGPVRRMAAPAAGSGPAVSASTTNPVQQPEELVTIVDEQNNVVRPARLRDAAQGGLMAVHAGWQRDA
jgi:hypothetical protein